jgi:hypothetical protein
MDEILAAVMEAELEMADGTDPAAVGAAVSDELCGRWDHDGPCRWPHRNVIEPARSPARFRTVVVCDERDKTEVLERIQAALEEDLRWRVVAVEGRATQDDERDITDHLRSVPRRGV